MAATATTTPSTVLPSRATSGGWRISVSILSVFGLVIFLLVYFAFWASGFSGLQSAVIVLASVLAFVAVNGAAWAPWGARYAQGPHA